MVYLDFHKNLKNKTVRLPEAVAVKVNPAGRPETVTSSAVKAVPSYTWLTEAAVKVMGVVLAVTFRVPMTGVTV